MYLEANKMKEYTPTSEDYVNDKEQLKIVQDLLAMSDYITPRARSFVISIAEYLECNVSLSRKQYAACVSIYRSGQKWIQKGVKPQYTDRSLRPWDPGFYFDARIYDED